jgi:signal transduction histidine kinase/ActR/RegA family two-component response regulator
MNLIAFFDLIAAAGFGAAVLIVIFFVSRDYFHFQSRVLLLLSLSVCLLVSISNVLEHAGITEYFDPFEDYLEILFTPFFLFFLFSVHAKLNHDQRLTAEAALRSALEKAEAEHSKLEAILAAIGDGISIQDRNFKVLYQNKVQKEMAGDHVGKFCYEAYEQRSEPCRGCPVEASFFDSRVHKAERSATRGNDTQYVEITASPIINHKGEVYAGIEVVRDVTNRKRMTEEILKAQKLESIGLLAGGIAHDFNNLLAAILGNISLAKTYAASDSKVMAKLEAAEKASLRGRELTKQLLTFSKGGTPVKKVMNINRLVRESSIFSLPGAGVKCIFALSDGLWPVEVDASQLSQVVNNLVINAGQAMPEGGLIHVSTENIMLSPGNSTFLAPGKYVCIGFTDQGQGIGAGHLSRIFDPFYSTKTGGTGLGLATAFSIIKNHGGHITVKSSPGAGAKFQIYLPAVEKGIEPPPAKDDELFTGQGRILFMDDDAAVRILAQDMLQHLGYKIVLANNGMEAVNIYKAAMEENNPFDAVILDLEVPGGMGGSEAGRKILTINPAARILVSSGYSNESVMANLGKYGFVGIIPKPYKIQELSRKLHDYLGNPLPKR